mgnify:CR=1 FL=1
MRVQFSSIDPKLDDLDHMAALCFRSVKFRIINASLGHTLRREGIWEDLIQEIYAAAWQAWHEQMSRENALRLTGRRINAFLKSYGFHHNGWKREVPTPHEDLLGRLAASQVQEEEYDGITSKAAEAIAVKRPHGKRLNRGLSAEDKILIILRESPDGISKADLYRRLQIRAKEFDYLLAPLVMSGEVIEVKRQNTIGRYPTPLLFIGTAEIPQEMLAVTDKRAQIRKAYFEEGKSIKRIVREYHCSKKTVHRIVRAVGKIETGEVEATAVQSL